MSKSQRFTRTPFSNRIDDAVATGGGLTVCYEGGDQEYYPPLQPALGATWTIRAFYRCAKCPNTAAEVREFIAEATGQQVWLFVGNMYRAEGDGQLGMTLHSFLKPDFGNPPVCMCKTHGLLEVDAETVRADILHSVVWRVARDASTSEKSRQSRGD
jgi:hypothetical protein